MSLPHDSIRRSFFTRPWKAFAPQEKPRHPEKHLHWTNSMSCKPPRRTRVYIYIPYVYFRVMGKRHCSGRLSMGAPFVLISTPSSIYHNMFVSRARNNKWHRKYAKLKYFPGDGPRVFPDEEKSRSSIDGYNKRVSNFYNTAPCLQCCCLLKIIKVLYSCGEKVG